ncbi:unnamed protein product [Echinostoma caproni]|uniref:GDNF domain-containing protein n=1 Tax=Echinostoma caproni TaxID=27848 RepID=A0A183A6E8_9TREM|nr:unnamed protein product [Echinostoma caproni]
MSVFILDKCAVYEHGCSMRHKSTSQVACKHTTASFVQRSLLGCNKQVVRECRSALRTVNDGRLGLRHCTCDAKPSRSIDDLSKCNLLRRNLNSHPCMQEPPLLFREESETWQDFPLVEQKRFQSPNTEPNLNGQRPNAGGPDRWDPDSATVNLPKRKDEDVNSAHLTDTSPVDLLHERSLTADHNFQTPERAKDTGQSSLSPSEYIEHMEPNRTLVKPLNQRIPFTVEKSSRDFQVNCYDVYRTCVLDPTCLLHYFRLARLCFVRNGCQLPTACTESLRGFYSVVLPDLTNQALGCFCRNPDLECKQQMNLFKPECAITDPSDLRSCNDVLQRCQEDKNCNTALSFLINQCHPQSKVCQENSTLCLNAYRQVWLQSIVTQCRCDTSNLSFYHTGTAEHKSSSYRCESFQRMLLHPPCRDRQANPDVLSANKDVEELSHFQLHITYARDEFSTILGLLDRTVSTNEFQYYVRLLDMATLLETVLTNTTGTGNCALVLARHHIPVRTAEASTPIDPVISNTDGVDLIEAGQLTYFIVVTALNRVREYAGPVIQRGADEVSAGSIPSFFRFDFLVALFVDLSATLLVRMFVCLCA